MNPSVIVVGLVFATSLVLKAATTPSTSPAPSGRALREWRDARFGMFVHWGPVSLKGTEIGWSRGAAVPEAEYDQLYRQFNPTAFDARAWARLAREAGMRYLILTSKHHDGFCLWPSDLTDYDMAATPFRRDVVGELAAACRREHLAFGLYHSLCDWHHPDYPLGSPGGRTRKPEAHLNRYVAYLQGQLNELLTRYGPLAVLWFDGEWESPWTDDLGRELDAFIRARQPGILINNRIGKGRHDMAGTTAAGAFAGDFDTPEQEVGKFQTERPWESCITICQQWAWKPDDKLKSLEECLRTLITCAGGDGNLLLNVGPMPDGRIEPRQADRLREIGAWLERYGQSIYGTRGGPYLPGTWGASTHRGRRLYLHAFASAKSPQTLDLPPLPATVRSARVVGGPRLAFESDAQHLRVELPEGHREGIVTVIELRLDRPVGDLSPIPVVPPKAP